MIQIYQTGGKPIISWGRIWGYEPFLIVIKIAAQALKADDYLPPGVRENYEWKFKFSSSSFLD